MKISENAAQKNITLNLYYYSEKDIQNLLENKTVCYWDDNYKDCYNYENWNSSIVKSNYYRWYAHRPELRLYTADLKKIEIQIDNNGMYTAVAIDNNNNKYFVLADQF